MDMGREYSPVKRLLFWGVKMLVNKGGVSANVAGLRALDHDDVVFVEVFALVYKFHLPLRTSGSGQSGR